MDTLFPFHDQPIDALTLDVLEKAAAKSTWRRYSRTIRSWLRYCEDRKISKIDASTDDVLRWIDNELRRVNSKTHVYIALSSLRMVQKALQGDKEPVPYRTSERPRLEMFVRSRVKASPHVKQVSPILLEGLGEMLRACAWRGLFARQGVNLDRARFLAIRDTALLTMLWWGAMRADDVTRIESVEHTGEGLKVTLHDSKTGAATIGICPAGTSPVCAVRAWERYESVSRTPFAGIPGAIGFNVNVLQVSRTVRGYATAAGLKGRYTGHSMRAGFATECARQGVPDRLVRSHARWTSTKTHEGYVRDGRLFIDSPTRFLTVADPPIVEAPVAAFLPSETQSTPANIGQASLGLDPVVE